VNGAQLVLDFPHRQSWDEADFFITSRNEGAFRLVTAWPDWQSPAAIIHGPPQSGKTYLANIWQARSDASFLDASKIAAHVWSEPYTPLIIEDIDTIAFDETALFHHVNLAREHGSSILFTAQTPPGQWAVALPDLRSRIRSYPAAGIQAPDEEHLAALLVKHFSDRQIEVTPGVISYLIARMERSMAAAQQLTAHIDKFALSEHRKVTRALAAKLFNELNAGEAGGNENHDDDPELRF
jgi:chromosomal replication initiation ATPase DnaA